jgi:DNA-binding response OmpR family regulator
MTQSPLSVLIVEDEYLIAMDLEQELADRGFVTIGPAGSLQDALGLLESEEVHLAVLDMHLKASDSFPLARRLTERGVPFLFLSGNDASALAPDLKFARVLPKPVDYDVLEAELRDLLPG